MPERSQVSGANPETLEREKQKHLAGKDEDSHTHPEHAPGWNEALASESEAVIKAEQSTDGPPSAKLQKRTAKHVSENITAIRRSETKRES